MFYLLIVIICFSVVFTEPSIDERNEENIRLLQKLGYLKSSYVKEILKIKRYLIQRC